MTATKKLGNDKAESRVWSGFQPWFGGRWPFSWCKWRVDGPMDRMLCKTPPPPGSQLLPRLSVRGDGWMSSLVRGTTDDNGTLRYLEGRPLPTTSTMLGAQYLGNIHQDPKRTGTPLNAPETRLEWVKGTPRGLPFNRRDGLGNRRYCVRSGLLRRTWRFCDAVGFLSA